MGPVIFVALSLVQSTVEISGPVPIGDRKQWIESSDYPLDAWLREEAGIASFEATINEQGNVIDCKILDSSGSAELDKASCNLYSTRGRFRPAVDSQGAPIVATYRDKIRWQLPDSSGRIVTGQGTVIPRGVPASIADDWRCGQLMVYMGHWAEETPNAHWFRTATAYFAGRLFAAANPEQMDALNRVWFTYPSVSAFHADYQRCGKRIESELNNPLKAIKKHRSSEK